MPTYQGQFVSGQTLNAADLNTFTPSAIYTSSGNQSVASATFATLNFATYSIGGITSWVGVANGRITPTISGWYLVTSNVQTTTGTSSRSILQIAKNGAQVFSFDIFTGTVGMSISGLVFCNGSTDYITSIVYQQTGVAVNYNSYQLSVSLMWQ
jgi:hypothetical protein